MFVYTYRKPRCTHIYIYIYIYIHVHIGMQSVARGAHLLCQSQSEDHAVVPSSIGRAGAAQRCVCVLVCECGEGLGVCVCTCVCACVCMTRMIQIRNMPYSFM